MERNLLKADYLDAALHLLDRQVVDVDDLLVCKVDDLEISLYDGGSPPAVTRVLAGPAALVPRLSSRTGQWLRARWISLGVQYADRDVPLSFPLGRIEKIGSGVELSGPREGLLDRQPRHRSGVELRRMGELLGMEVRGGDSRLRRHKVLDVRLRPRASSFVFEGLLIGPGRPGSLLGYGRGDFDGPWLVAKTVERLHRHMRQVSWDGVQSIDWTRGTLTLRDGEMGRLLNP